MNNSRYLFCAIICFAIAVFMILVETQDIIDDYKEYGKIHIYCWNIIFFIYGIMWLYLSWLCINKIIY